MPFNYSIYLYIEIMLNDIIKRNYIIYILIVQP